MTDRRFVCARLADALRDEEPGLLEAAREHARECRECGAALAAWDAVATTAASLRRSWESPELEPRIRRALLKQSNAKHRLLTPAWSYALLAASVLLAVSLAINLRGRSARPPVDEAERQLLTERAMAAVERSEADYVFAIERLAKLAEPVIEQSASPLMASYREKLEILDAAIAECRAQIERNRWNAHLRHELLSVYREKQRTLEKLMQEKS